MAVPMSGKSQRLVTDELVEVRDLRELPAILGESIEEYTSNE